MKLQADRFDTLAIHAYGPGWVSVNGQKMHSSLLVSAQGLLCPWRPQQFDDLQAADFTALLAEPPELVVFGSGARLRFPSPALLQDLMRARIGIETMDTMAACRTYNILAGEGRRVLAALLLDPA
jgi:uncharacterized protein